MLTSPIAYRLADTSFFSFSHQQWLESEHPAATNVKYVLSEENDGRQNSETYIFFPLEYLRPNREQWACSQSILGQIAGRCLLSCKSLSPCSVCTWKALYSHECSCQVYCQCDMCTRFSPVSANGCPVKPPQCKKWAVVLSANSIVQETTFSKVCKLTVCHKRTCKKRSGALEILMNTNWEKDKRGECREMGGHVWSEMSENPARESEPKRKNPQVAERAAPQPPSGETLCPVFPWQRWAFRKLTTCTHSRVQGAPFHKKYNRCLVCRFQHTSHSEAFRIQFPCHASVEDPLHWFADGFHLLFVDRVYPKGESKKQNDISAGCVCFDSSAAQYLAGVFAFDKNPPTFVHVQVAAGRAVRAPRNKNIKIRFHLLPSHTEQPFHLRASQLSSAAISRLNCGEEKKITLIAGSAKHRLCASRMPLRSLRRGSLYLHFNRRKKKKPKPAV